MKKQLILFITIGLMFLFAACGDGNDSSAQSPEQAVSSRTDATLPAESGSSAEEEPGSGQSGEENGAETPMSIVLGKDTAGNDIVRIAVTLPNHADYPINCLSDCSEKVTQNGQALEMITSKNDVPDDFLTVNGENTWYTFTDAIQPEKSIDVYLYYRLKNTADPITITLEDFSSGIVYSKTLPLS